MSPNKLWLIYRDIKLHRKTLINSVSVLVAGLIFSLLFFLYWTSKYNIVKHNENDCLIFQVMMNRPSINDGTPTFLAEDLAGEMPEVEYAVTIEPSTTSDVLWNKGVLFCPDQGEAVSASSHFVSEDFFEVLEYDLTYMQMPTNEKTIYISEEIALKLFGNWKTALGKKGGMEK